MTRRRKIGKRRSNETAHRRALADPNIASLVKDLRLRWKSLDRIERADRLGELAALGCSTRGLGTDLRQSATSIRRYIDISKLPIAQREALGNGESAKKMLGRIAAAKRARRSQERVRADGETGALSNEMADVALDFCRTVKGVPERPVQKPMVPQFLECVMRAMSANPRANRSSPRFSKRLSTRELFKKTRPAETEESHWMEFQARWLAAVIFSKTPEVPIWERVLRKVARRAAELEPKKTPGQSYQERIAHLKWVSQGPERRKY